MPARVDEKIPRQKISLLQPIKEHLDLSIGVAIAAIAFAVRLYGLMDEGITWDEPTTINAAISYVKAILNSDFGSGAWAMNYEHPPIGKYIYGVAIWLLNGSSTNLNGYEVARLASVCMGVATCLLVYFIGKEYFNREIGAISALILAFIPVFVANTQIAALDSPLALFFTLTMFLFLRAVQKNSTTYYGLSALSLGLLIGVKLNGLLILPIMAIFYVLARREYLATHVKKAVRHVKGKKEAKAADDNIIALIKAYCPPMAFVGFCLITVLSIFLLWPWLWYGTISHLSMTLSHWTYAPQEYFLGTVGQPPIYYYIVYFVLTTPLLLFIPLALGLYKNARFGNVFKYAILLWFFVPFAYSFSSFKQDGMRYLIMIYPAMALLCGSGLYEIATLIGKLNVPAMVKKVTLPGLCALTVIYLIICLSSVYPYYLDYYNSLTGGYQHIQTDRSLVLGWWGEGIYGAEKYVSDTGGKNSTAIVVTMPQDATYQLYGLRPTFSQVGLTNVTSQDYILKLLNPDAPGSENVSWRLDNTSFKPDYLITNFYAEEYYNVSVDPAHFKEVYATGVQGVPLVKVYKVL